MAGGTVVPFTLFFAPCFPPLASCFLPPASCLLPPASCFLHQAAFCFRHPLLRHHRRHRP
ncbi:MAG: hypothetical protein DRI80_16595 [Chloroflexota bacterium]|nr:MAG: hypothetical protein DRI80_16595 [Chloroflexota bacterium]